MHCRRKILHGLSLLPGDPHPPIISIKNFSISEVDNPLSRTKSFQSSLSESASEHFDAFLK
ncbi:hypothetical protein BpHYR1_041667 [Brachionus plicatilis]|uniref:Uncharacterized protein n=1 Tax=Brachionus plicatilis TaxID=10195 RepID=A0A3M7STP2_BRAPC|nr:hypothetical protein BpHYR1_041667 [Brachionus plicatilis]